jgi:hypothetical protein
MVTRSRSSFYRPQLAATRRQTADPCIPFYNWLSRLQELYSLWQDAQMPLRSEKAPVRENASSIELPWTSQECYDFLACVGALLRTPLGQAVTDDWQLAGPPPVPSAEGDWTSAVIGTFQGKVWPWALQTCRQYGWPLLAAALAVPHPLAWRRLAREIAAQTESAASFQSRRSIRSLSRRVLNLWKQLDEAELVYALGYQLLNHPPQEPHPEFLQKELWEKIEALDTGLIRCGSWLQLHLPVFLPIAAYIQMVAAGFRTDLEKDTPRDDGLLLSLYNSVIKYGFMLDTLESAEGCISGVTGSSLLERTIKLLAAALVPTASPATTGSSEEYDTSSWFHPRTDLEPCLAAASGDLPPLKTLVWESPDQRYLARLFVGTQQALLRFYQIDGDYATALSGEPVYLAKVPALIESPGQAYIPLSLLLASPEPLYLEVGSRRTRWRPVRAPASS